MPWGQAGHLIEQRPQFTDSLGLHLEVAGGPDSRVAGLDLAARRMGGVWPLRGPLLFRLRAVTLQLFFAALGSIVSPTFVFLPAGSGFECSVSFRFFVAASIAQCEMQTRRSIEVCNCGRGWEVVVGRKAPWPRADGMADLGGPGPASPTAASRMPPDRVCKTQHTTASEGRHDIPSAAISSPTWLTSDRCAARPASRLLPCPVGCLWPLTAPLPLHRQITRCSAVVRVDSSIQGLNRRPAPANRPPCSNTISLGDAGVAPREGIVHRWRCGCDPGSSSRVQIPPGPRSQSPGIHPIDPGPFPRPTSPHLTTMQVALGTLTAVCPITNHFPRLRGKRMRKLSPPT